MSPQEELQRLRDQIDLLDTELVVAMSRRMDLARQVMRLKETQGDKPRDLERERQQRLSYTVQARMFHLDEAMVCEVFAALHEGAVALYRYRAQ